MRNGGGGRPLNSIVRYHARTTETNHSGGSTVGTIEITVLLVVALVAFAWIVAKFIQGASAPHAESSARADTFGAGAGYAAEKLDEVRQFQRKDQA